MTRQTISRVLLDKYRDKLRLMTFTNAMRERMMAMPPLTAIEITGEPWIPSTVWVTTQNQRIGGYYSNRKMGNRRFIFRLE